ncbi:UbiA family prenyltransferase [Nonlabens ponticola]|uniref:Prenyltransferase n=1 Tax=Nonlabens ponticola TaxID=2496866 RepID=A0A3S9N0J8_9FLAO|nr:UbiA family prenyltransferase [Nonlabens ponticola]AZQ44918.1 hypothetical protein EJ995_12040 [Nonlabens ponticola]
MGLFAVLFFTVRAVAFDGQNNPIDNDLQKSWWWIVTGVIAVISFFFRLRVFDEIKDFSIDSVNHPDRVLQSGRVHLKQLQIISYSLIALEVGWSLLTGVPTFLGWLAAVGYSLLMRYEFFVPVFLKKSLILYGFTHMLIMPLIILWIYVAHAGLYFPLAFWYVCAASLLAGFSFEIARKIHAPSHERSGIDSYSKSLGFKVAVGTLLIVLAGGLAVQYLLLNALAANWYVVALIGIIYLLLLILYITNLRKPDENQLRKGELLVSLFMIASYLSVIIVVNFL